MPQHIDLKQPILDKNDRMAGELRQRFADAGVYVLDLLASPGVGQDVHHPGHHRRAAR